MGTSTKEDEQGASRPVQLTSECESLAARIVSAQEQERARIARDLHDDICQQLGLVALELSHLQAGVSESEARTGIDTVLHKLGHVIEDLHGISHRLHPSIVRDLGAAAAIKAECQNFARQHRIPAHFRNEGIGDLPEQTGLTLFRILQEALHNIAKHAHTTAVHVRLDRVEDCVCLRIQDSGVGFDVARAPARLGLASMRERVALARGNLTIQSSPGRGTLVEAVVPAPAALEPNHIA